jgi:hypothetical protein
MNTRKRKLDHGLPTKDIPALEVYKYIYVFAAGLS